VRSRPDQRRRGIGTFAVAAIVEYCRAAKRHRQLEASTLRVDPAALAFWRRQGFRTASEDPVRLSNVLELS
jgi:GNAT superfamily N-acetyltransferase